MYKLSPGFKKWTSSWQRWWKRGRVGPRWFWCSSSLQVFQTLVDRPAQTVAPLPQIQTAVSDYCQVSLTCKEQSKVRNNTWKLCSTGEFLPVTRPVMNNYSWWLNVYLWRVVWFNRYGENGTISLAGLKRLLQSVGLDRIRTVTVQHHEQPGHHNHQHDHHHHHHHHVHNNSSHHQKHVHAETSQPRKSTKTPEVSKDQDVTLGKKEENPELHHHLYDKKTMVAEAQEVGTTAAYSAQLLVKPEAYKRQDSSLEQPTPAGEANTGTTTKTLVTENQIQTTGVSPGDDHNHDHEHDHDHDHEHDHDHDHDHDHNHNQDLLRNRSLDSEEVHSESCCFYLWRFLSNLKDKIVLASVCAHYISGYNIFVSQKTFNSFPKFPNQIYWKACEKADVEDLSCIKCFTVFVSAFKYPVWTQFFFFHVANFQCMNASSILSTHGMSQEMGVTLSDFSYLCPALLNQIDGGACILHEDPSEHGKRGTTNFVSLLMFLLTCPSNRSNTRKTNHHNAKHLAFWALTIWCFLLLCMAVNLVFLGWGQTKQDILRC